MHKSEIESFRTETLIAHNQFRAQHSTTPLSLSFQLCDGAQNWADRLAENDQFERSPEDKYYNENIACTWGSQITGTLISRMWYEEGKDYDYTRNTLSKFTQNFTQLLWKESREMGVGRARSKHGKEIIVARYHPPGNTGDFTANVLRRSEFRETSIPVIDNLALNRIPGLRQFQEDCLLAHNKYRLRHRAPPLQWSYKLAYEAQKWAQHLLDSELFTHSEDIVYGENLAGRKGYDLNGKRAAKLWYDESKLFNFEEPSFSPDTGNFTQLIWRGSRYFGVGKAFNNDMCIVVAYYFPPGNIVEEFNENVGIIEDSVDGVIAETTKPAGLMAEYGQYELETFRTEFLVFINYLRARHASPPLTVSHLLMNNAQNWANQLLRSGKITYTNDENIGESIAYAEREDLTAFKVSHRWYGEIQSHDFSSASPNAETLNFTQLVWHDSRELGVGKAVGKDGFSVVVAQYSPPGNTDGIVKENIGKLCSPDMKEIASIKKRSYDENANIIEDKGIKNSFAGIISPSRTEETFVFRPPSGEFNQLVWIDRSSTPLESGKQPEVNGDVVMKESTPEHEYESPPPSPSRAVDQIEKLLTNTRQTWETESSGEDDIDEGTEPRKPDVNEYVVRSKSTSREDIGSEEGSVYKRLSRTFSEEMEYSRQESVREEEEPPSKSPDHPQEDEKESTAENVSEDAKKEELKNDNGVQSPIVLRKSQQYVHHYDKEFGQVKEASIVTRPEVSNIENSEDWQMIDDIIQSPRTLRLSQHMNDETFQSPQDDGQRAVIRRIDDENTTTSDPALPVLEHVVTPTFARTVDHRVVDEELNNLFSEDMSGNEPEAENQNLQADSTPTFKDRKYEKEEKEQFLSDRPDHVEPKVLEPIEHINISREIRECSYAVSDDVFNLIEEFPSSNQSLHEKSSPTGTLEEESVSEGQTQVLLEESILQEELVPTAEKTKNDSEAQQLQDSPEEKLEHYVPEQPGADESFKKEEILLQESIFQEKPVSSLEETDDVVEEQIVEDIPEEELGQLELSDYPEAEHVKKEDLSLEDSTFQEKEVFIVEKTKSSLQEQSLEQTSEEKLEYHEVSEYHKQDFMFQKETVPRVEEADPSLEEKPPKDSPVERLEQHVLEYSQDESAQNKELLPEESILEDELASSIEKAKGFVEEQPVKDILDEKLEQHDVCKDPEEGFVEQQEGLGEEAILRENVSSADETRHEQHDVFENPEKEEILLDESISRDEQASSIEETRCFIAEQPIEFNAGERIDDHDVSEHTEEQPEKREEVLIEKSILQKEVLVVEETKGFLEEQLVEKSPEEKLEQYDVSEHHEEHEPVEKEELLPEESILEDKSAIGMEETKSFVEQQPAKDSLEQKLEQYKVSEHPAGESIEEILSVEPTEESDLEQQPFEQSSDENLAQNEVSEYPEDEVSTVEETIRFVEEQPIEDSHKEKLEQHDVSKHSEEDESFQKEELLPEPSILEDEADISAELTTGMLEEQPAKESSEEKHEQRDVSEDPEEECVEKEILLIESIYQKESVLSSEETQSFVEEEPTEDSPEQKLDQNDIFKHSEAESFEKKELLLEESIFQEEPVPGAKETKEFVEEQSLGDSPKEKLEQHDVFETPENKSVEKVELLIEESIFQQEHALSLKETQSFVEDEPTKDSEEQKLDQHEVSEHSEEQSVEKKEILPEETLFPEEPLSSVEQTQSFSERQSIEDNPEKQILLQEFTLQEEDALIVEDTKSFLKQPSSEEKLEQHDVSEYSEGESLEQREVLEDESIFQEPVSTLESTKSHEEEQLLDESPKEKLQDSILQEVEPVSSAKNTKLEQHGLSEDLEKESAKEGVLEEESMLEEQIVPSVQEIKALQEEKAVEETPGESLESLELLEHLTEDKSMEKDELLAEQSISEEPTISVEKIKSSVKEQPMENSLQQQPEHHELEHSVKDESDQQKEVLLEESTCQKVHIVEETRDFLEEQPLENDDEKNHEHREHSEQLEEEAVEREEKLVEESTFLQETKSFVEAQLVENSPEETWLEPHELPEHYKKDESVEKEEALPEEPILKYEPFSSVESTKGFVEERSMEYSPDETLGQHDVSKHSESESAKNEVLEEEEFMLQERTVSRIEETKRFDEEPDEGSPDESLEHRELLEHPEENKSVEKELLLEQSVLEEESTVNAEKTKSFVREQPIKDSPEEMRGHPELSEDSEEDASVQQEDVLLEEPICQEDDVHIAEETRGFFDEQSVENSAEENFTHPEHSEQPEEESVEREVKLEQKSSFEEETTGFVAEQPIEDSEEEKLEQQDVSKHSERESAKNEVLEEEAMLQEETRPKIEETKRFDEQQPPEDSPNESLEHQELLQHPEELLEQSVLEEEPTVNVEKTKNFVGEQQIKDSLEEMREPHELSEDSEEDASVKQEDVLLEEPICEDDDVLIAEETRDFLDEQPDESSAEENLKHSEHSEQPEEPVEREEKLVEEPISEEETKSFVEEQPVENSAVEKLEQHNVSEDREEGFVEPQEVLTQESIFQKPFSTVEDTKDLNEEQPVEDSPEEELERQELPEYSEDECVKKQPLLAEEPIFQDEPVFSVEDKKGFVEEQPERPEEQHEQHACDHPDEENGEKQELLLETSIEQLLDDRQEEKLGHPELPEHSQKDEFVEKDKIVLEESILPEEPVSSVEETESYIEEQPIKYNPHEKLEQSDVPEHREEGPDERQAVLMEKSIFQKEEQLIDDSPGEKHDLSKHHEEDKSVEKEEVLPEDATIWEEPIVSMEDTVEKEKKDLPVVDQASEKEHSFAGNLKLEERETTEKEGIGWEKIHVSTKDKQTTQEELPVGGDVQGEEQDENNGKVADKEEREKYLAGERKIAEKLEIQDKKEMLVLQDDKEQPNEQLEENNTTINEKSANDREQKIEQHGQFMENLEEKSPEPDTEAQETEEQESEHSPKHVRFSSACEVFEENSMPIVATVEFEDTTTAHKDVQKICKEGTEESVNQEELQADEDDVDMNSRWVEVEKNPVVWHTVTATQEEPEQKSNEKECDPVVTEGVERNTTKENEPLPDEVIYIGAHTIVKDVLKHALDQTEEKSDVSFTPRLVRTESGNMVVVKMEEPGSLEERYELMEFELYEQYMKEKGTFSPFQSEFPCDVDKVFSSTEADKPLEPLEELEFIGEEEDDIDYGSERPLLASHLSIIMEEPPSGTDSLTGSLVKLQTNENVQTDTTDNSGEYEIASPSEFDIVHSTVREVQNKRQKTEMSSDKNLDDESAQTTDDEFILLWRSSEKQPNVHETAGGDKQGLEGACIGEQEINQETPIRDFEECEENTKEKVSASESEQMDYLKLDLRGSPEVPSESSVSPGSSVRSWISSDLSSLDDETTGKHKKNREDSDISTEEKEILGVELIGSELSRHEQAMEPTYEDQKVVNYPNESKATEPEANVDNFQEQIIPLELECPPDSCTKHVAVSTEQDGDKKVTRVVTTETTRKVVKIVDGKEVPLEGEEWGQFESKFRDLLEKKGTYEQPTFATEEHDDGCTKKTITTVVTRHEEKGPVVASDKTDSVEKESETEQCHVQSGVVTEEQDNGEVKTTITRVVTRNVEVEPALELGEHVGKKHIESSETPVEMITNDQGNDKIRTNVEHLSESAAEIMDQSSEKEVITEEQDEDGTKTTITRVVTTTAERAPISDLATEGAVGEIFEKIQKEAGLGESEITTEEHDEDGVKTTITRVITRKEISEPKLISDEQFRETFQPFHKETEQLEPVVTDISEEDDGIVKRTVTRTVTRTVKTEPILTSGDQDDSIKAMLEKLKEQEGNDQEYPQLEFRDDDDKMIETETAGQQHNTEIREDQAQEIGDFPTERKVSHEETKDEDGTVTTITRIETHRPMVLAHPDVLKEMLERTDEHSLEIAPSVEHVDHSDDHVVRDVKTEVQEVTTMESTSALVLLGDFQTRVLLEHNKCRYIHYSKPLTWSDRLAKEAQIWAEHLAESGCLKHSTSSEYGENVAYSSEVLNGYDLSQLWYDEIKHYSFLKPGFTTQTAHFTQMVWEGTREMGVGMALAPDGTSYFVARYYPPGNKLGSFEENVLSPRENAVEGRPRKKKSISPPSPPNEIETVKHDCLVTHNYYRFQHGASELSWSPMLAVEALHSAERVIRTGSIHSSDRSNSGENIAMSSDRSFDVKAAIELWYKEEKDYDYTSPAFSSLTRNFSQMLWKECKEVGMALARSDSGDFVVVVAKYYPPGNVVGMFQDNVLPTSQESGL